MSFVDLSFRTNGRDWYQGDLRGNFEYGEFAMGKIKYRVKNHRYVIKIFEDNIGKMSGGPYIYSAQLVHCTVERDEISVFAVGILGGRGLRLLGEDIVVDAHGCRLP